MPINGLWTIRMAVTRRMPEDTAGESVVVRDIKRNAEIDCTSANGDGGEGFDHDPTDWVSIRMGPSLTTLHHVADVKNVVNDDLGEVKRSRFSRVVEWSMLCSFPFVGEWEVHGRVFSNREQPGAICREENASEPR